MKSWDEKKKEIKSVNTNRINELEAVAQLVNAINRRRIELGWTQRELAGADSASGGEFVTFG
jgi:hypothetical protein